MKVKEPPIIVEQVFQQPRETVWNAITDVDEMRRWSFNNIPDLQPVVGFQTQFNVQTSSRDFLHLWQVTEVVLHEKIVVNWKYENFSGNSYVTLGISEKEGQTKLIVYTKVVQDFDDSYPEFRPDSGVAG